MATVFVTVRRYRVAVNSLDHPPPHVHVYGKGLAARFLIGCDDGTVELWDATGGWHISHLNELGEEIAEKLGDCCRTWREIHG